VLPTIFATFRASHPGVEIELALTNRTEDLARRDADIAVRMVRPTQSALVARRIGETCIGLFAHRDYLDRFGTPTTIADLAGHRMIGFDRDDRSFRFAGPFAAAITRDRFGFRCDDDLGQLAALRAGVGIGGCQENIAERSPELTPVLRDAFSFPLEIWLVLHEDVKATPRVRAMFDHLATGLTNFVHGRLWA
jgi:DNA-binding transcriptional LysR family regulator